MRSFPLNPATRLRYSRRIVTLSTLISTLSDEDKRGRLYAAYRDAVRKLESHVAECEMAPGHPGSIRLSITPLPEQWLTNKSIITPPIAHVIGRQGGQGTRGPQGRVVVSAVVSRASQASARSAPHDTWLDTIEVARSHFLAPMLDRFSYLSESPCVYKMNSYTTWYPILSFVISEDLKAAPLDGTLPDLGI